MSRDVEAGNAYVRVSLRGLDKASKKFKRWGSKLQSAGVAMTAAGAAMAVPFIMAVKAFSDFDDAMRAVKGVTRDGAKHFDALRAKAMELGETTSFTALEVGALMTILGRAEFPSADIINMTGSVLALARATGTDAALASDVLGKSLKQFGLTSKDAGMAADLLTTAANRSFNTVEDLGESLKFAAPTAEQFGMSMKDTLAIVGTLGNVGIQGTMAGTMLRRMMIISGAEAEKMGAVFGETFRDINGDALPFIEILEIIGEKTKDLGSGERAAKLNEAFGLRGITGISALGKNIGSIKSLQNELESAGGSAQKVSKEMDAGIGGAFRKLMSAVEGLKIRIGDQLAPALQAIAGWLRSVTKGVSEFVKKNRALVVGIAAGVAGFLSAGVALLAFGIFLKVVAFGLATLGAMVSGVGVMFAVLTSPITLAIAAIGAAVATATWFFFNITETGKKLFKWFKEKFTTLKKIVGDTMDGISAAIKTGNWELVGKIAWTGLKLAWFDMTDDLRTKWIEFLRWFADSMVGMAEMVAKISPAWEKTVKEFRSAMNDSFDADVAKGAERIKQLQKELAALKKKAEMEATALKGKKETDEYIRSLGGDGKGGGAGGALAGASAGTFSAAAAAVMFDRGGGTTEKKIERNTRETKDGIKKLIRRGSYVAPTFS